MPDGSVPDIASILSQMPGGLAPSNMPTFKKPGGMFGGGKADIGSAIAAALNGYLAAGGNPAGQYGLQMLNERRMMAQRQALADEQYQRERQDKQTDWRSQYDYELAHPKTPNNDTANDYSFWQQHLSPDQFKEYISNKVNPPQYMNVPGVGLVQVPRQSAPQGAPTAPVGKLTPLGAGGPGASPGGFQQF